MPDRIKLLPDNIANQIAAGEVIQRPASVVKELLENAVDAGSTKIQLNIKDAGKTLIQVIDNGCGMSPTDARMSFERHATSKINTADDLFNLHTKGFRGEALASIAAIAQVELVSRLPEAEMATQIQMEGATIKNQTACQAASGTKFSVKNLFYNVPARRNFLKSTPVETRHIIDEFIRVAMAHPNIAFTLNNNGEDTFLLSAGSLKQRIVGILGKKYNENLATIKEATDFLSIDGFIGKPEFSKKTRGEQFFFVNNRFIKSAYLNHAVMRAYSQLISKDTYPFYAIFITIDPKRIDVNIHPTKQEIKFDDERVVYTFINAGVRHSLGLFSNMPSIDFEQEASFNKHPLTSNQSTENLKKQYDGGHFANRGLRKDWSETPVKANTGVVTNWQDLYEIAKGEKINSSTQNTQNTQMETITVKSTLNESPPQNENLELNLFDAVTFEPVQVHQKYILTQIRSGLVLIDQHAAHVRILYEQLIQSLASQAQKTQQLLFPKKITLSTADAQLLTEIIADICKLGIDIKPLAGNDFVVHGLPADAKYLNEQHIIENLVEAYKQNINKASFDKKTDLAKTIAQQTALKSNTKLAVAEMKEIIDRLFACEVPYVSPNGTLTFITLSLQDLEKQFSPKG